MKETQHFQIGHMCAGCEVSTVLHTGCVVNKTVRVIKNDRKIDQDTKTLDRQFDKVILKKD